MNSTPELIHVVRPEGHIAVEVSGPSEGGPLVVLIPGMGDLRGTYRFLVPALVEAGYRVAATDLRGHGDSDVTFAHYGDLTQIKRSLQRPGYGAAFSKLARTLTHAPAEAKLGAVRAPSLILMGALDPDSPAPADEVDWIAAQLGGPAEGTVVEECGHYPQSQRPDVVNPAVVAFLGQVARA
jgi:pimeloyl-ACP methyl ester carboxylesterase